MARLKPDVLVGPSTPPALALKKATASIPIVIVGVGGPIATGLVESLAHPAGNVTGTANAAEEWQAKRLQMVTEVVAGYPLSSVSAEPGEPVGHDGSSEGR